MIFLYPAKSLIRNAAVVADNLLVLFLDSLATEVFHFGIF
jgi:hypothetical protein